MDKENDLDLIIDYINGELSAEQKILLEKRLTQDLDLVESLRIQKDIHHAFLRLQISEQIKSIHEDAKLEQENIVSKNYEAKPSFVSDEKTNKAYKILLRKIAAVFITIIFIGSLWSWFNHNSRNPETIVNTITPINNVNTSIPEINQKNIEINDSKQNIKEESDIKQIDVVQLNPDVNFGFAQKNEVSKKMFLKRIWNSPNGFNSVYKLNTDTLFLYFNANSELKEFLVEIHHEDDSQSTLENGFYLMLDNHFYQLDNNNKLNKLMRLKNKNQVSELNKLLRKK